MLQVPQVFGFITRAFNNFRLQASLKSFYYRPLLYRPYYVLWDNKSPNAIPSDMIQ